MARKTKFQMDPPPGMDMTPIIDIVFNLIIFFMIASELASQDLEAVFLPFADRCEKGKPVKDPETGKMERILQINVLNSGLMKVRGKPYTADPNVKANSRHGWLGDLLEAEAAGYDREPPDPAAPNVHPSKLRINIRADKRAPFKFVQQVFDQCVKQGIYKTSLAATPDPLAPEK